MRYATLLLFLLTAMPALAGADLLDYDPDSPDWTGLSRFIDAGRTVGVTLTPTQTLDFRDLDPEQPLVILYPQEPLDVPNLIRFVSDGGRILLADDFGESEALLDRLEIQRVLTDPGNLPHTTYAGGNVALPIITARGRHDLLEGVGHVVANHPSVITNVGGPVLRYDSGGGFVYDMNLGDGKVVVVADASLFINRMLGEADNEVFAANALRYICRDNPSCAPRLLTKRFAQVGSYRDSMLDLGDGRSVDAINEALKQILDALPDGEFLYWMSLLLGLGLAVYLGTVFPIRKTRPYSAYVSDFLGAIPSPQSEFDWNVSRFGRGSRTMNYALPMAILKEIFEELFLDALGHWPSRAQERPDVQALGELFADRYLVGRTQDDRNAAKADVVRLLATFAQIPPRPRVFLDNDTHFGEADLLEHHRRAIHVLKIMGLADEYQRRTRGNV